MPLRAYEPVSAPCRLCGSGFDVVQQAREPTLQECPRCGQAIRLRNVEAVSSPKLTKAPAVTDAKAAGFTVLKRVNRGEYEKQ